MTNAPESVEAGGRRFTVLKRDEHCFSVEVDRGEDNVFIGGALVQWVDKGERPGWKITLVAPAKLHNHPLWRRSVPPVVGEQAASTVQVAAELVANVLDQMRFDDPLVAGDPREEKLPTPIRRKLAALRMQVQQEREEHDDDLAEVLTPLVVDADLAPVSRIVLCREGREWVLGPGTKVVFHSRTGTVTAEFLNGQLLVEGNRLAVHPYERNVVRLTAQEL